MMNPILLIDGSSLAFLHAGKSNYKITLRNHLKTLKLINVIYIYISPI